MLSVHDNGHGLPARSAPSMGGYGLRNLRERAYALGDNVHVQSPAGGGTKVRVRLPAAPTT